MTPPYHSRMTNGCHAHGFAWAYEAPKTRPRKAVGMAPIIVLLGAISLLSLGCSGGATGTNTRTAGDPLLGGQPPLDANAKPKAGTQNPTTGTNTGAGGLPGLPVPSSSTSPAALATGGVPQLDNTRDLRIAAGPGGGATGAATLGKPEPVRGTTTGGSGASIQPTTPSLSPSSINPASINTVDQGIQYLTNRGAQGFRLELQRDTSQWHCSCSLPNPQNTSVKRTYDFTANDPLSAIRAVSERVARDNP